MGIKYKIVRFVFPLPLARPQEDLFISFFQAIAELARKKIANTKKALELPIYKGNEIATVKRNSLEMILEGWTDIMRLEKEDGEAHGPAGTTYKFMIAFEQLGVMDVDMGLVKLDFWKRFQDSFTGRFKKEVCRKLGFSPNDVLIEFGEETVALKESGEE